MRATTHHLNLPFFTPAHQTLAEDLAIWVARQTVHESDDRSACKEWVRLLGDAGWLRYCVPAQFGGAMDKLDSRALAILREALAFHSPLADFAFAMQGLGSGAITLAGTPAQQAAYLPAVARGDKIAAFALSELDAGSDAVAMKTVANYTYGTRATGINDIQNTEKTENVTLNGTKTWISNGGIADYYCVFAKTDPQAGTRGITAFIVDADAKGLDTAEHIQVMAPHPLTQAKLGDMAALIDAAALLTYRAAWLRDCVGTALGPQAQAYTAAAAMAKMTATENDQRVIDMALQMHGGMGVKVGTKVESLYRDIRSLRIYEGATEVQQLTIGKSVLKG